MILRTLSFDNFGVYGGRVELDLAPRRRRGSLNPIILVGGKNGVGKTTLLEAVRLALYGRRALGSRVSQAEYDEYLRRCIHRPPDSTAVPDSASVALEFDYAEDGIVHRYRVRRAWSARGRTVVESLVLEQDGVLVRGLPREEWQHFLQDLIPPGVSQLFFFDGEKIQDIADSGNDEQHLADAVRGLLGIELIARLRMDLGLYLARHQRVEHDLLTARLEPVLRDLAGLEERIASSNEVIAQLSTERDSHTRAAEHARRRFVAEGGDLAARRSQIEAEVGEVERQIERRRNQLRDLAGGLLPLTVAPRVTRAFGTALRKQIAYAHAAGRSRYGAELQNAMQTWRRANAPMRNASWDSGHWADLEEFLSSWGVADSMMGAPQSYHAEDPQALLVRLEEAEALTRPRAAEIADDLETLTSRRAELETMLVRADGAATNLLFEELRLAEQRVGATEAKLHAAKDDHERLQSRRTLLQREREQLLQQQIELAASERRTDLAVRASQALVDYEARLLTHKLSQLRSEFVQCFNRLARKGDLVSDVRIDPDTFAVTLIDHAGGEMPKRALSAGEKQVYAIAILWALARTSGRPLPMIIDTPLARLDSDHRINLVERYFPSVSHQVVLLSTDTEVDASLLQALAPHVSHAYHLDYDSSRGRTIPEAGYFWAVGNVGTAEGKPHIARKSENGEPPYALQ